MQLEVNDEVFFIHANTIYKGHITEKQTRQDNVTLYRVNSPLGLTLIKESALHKSIDKLVEAIMYQEPVRASQEFKTWAVS